MNYKYKIDFFTDDPWLDIIAVQIIWDRDSELWNKFVSNYPSFEDLKVWNNELVQAKLNSIYKNNRIEIRHAIEKINDWWNPLDKQWFDFLEDIFTIRDSYKDSRFSAFLGVSSISPRDIKKGSFLVPFTVNKNELLKICAHETTHFYFYKKLEETRYYKMVNSKKIWLISEILVPLIFGDPWSANIIGKMPLSTYVCEDSLVKRCSNCYNDWSKKLISFEKFLDQIFQIEIKQSELNLKYM